MNDVSIVRDGLLHLNGRIFYTADEEFRFELGTNGYDKGHHDPSDGSVYATGEHCDPQQSADSSVRQRSADSTHIERNQEDREASRAGKGKQIYALCIEHRDHRDCAQIVDDRQCDKKGDQIFGNAGSK